MYDCKDLPLHELWYFPNVHLIYSNYSNYSTPKNIPNQWQTNQPINTLQHSSASFTKTHGCHRHPPAHLAAHGFLHLPAVRVGGIRRHEAFHATGLHRDDAHGDATQASAAHDDGLTPALQVPGLKGSLNSLVMDWWIHVEFALWNS